ncbi:MAG: cation diffusion facilitator family transporter [Candidatus Omnitrophota bacterium]
MLDYFVRVRRILLGILILNWLVAFAKLAYGYFTHCASMAADGMHSFSDGATNVIGLLGIWAASKPVDKTHPYGHKKYETFASLSVSFLLFLLALLVVHGAITRLVKHSVPNVTLLSFAVMLGTMCINLFVIFYETKKGRELKSDFLIADAIHTKGDMLVSLCVIGALVSAKLGYPAADPIFAFIIAGFIAKLGFEVARRSSGVLCDGAVVPPEDINKVVMGIKGVKECHMIRTRGRVDDVHIDLHLIVDTNMHVDVAHNLAHAVEDKIKKAIKGVTDVVVHIEPISAKTK